MSESPYPSQNQDKFVVRLPDGMRDRIKAVAEHNSRSMNAEIVATLERVYPPADQVALINAIMTIEGRLELINPRTASKDELEQYASLTEALKLMKIAAGFLPSRKK